MQEDEATFLETVREGAIGFLLRDCSAADVLTAVRTIVQGEAFCPPRLCLALLNHISNERLPLPSIQVKLQLGLTRRQQQIVPLIAKGWTNKEIACQLNLSEQTIKNHIHSMLRRTGANDRLAVVDLNSSNNPSFGECDNACRVNFVSNFRQLFRSAACDACPALRGDFKGAFFDSTR